MFRSYDPVYLEKAQNTLGNMLDFAVYSLHRNASEFFDLFIASGAASLFEEGDIRILAGISGAELAFEVMDRSGLAYERVRPRFTTQTSKEMICGKVLALTQWQNACPFAALISVVSVAEIISDCEKRQNEIRRQLAEAWPPVMDSDSPEAKKKRDRESVQIISESINKKMSSAVSETHLKTIRQRNGLSQSKLAEISGVPVRTIQQYEQRQKSINKAQSEYLINLARALNCPPESLLEFNQ